MPGYHFRIHFLLLASACLLTRSAAAADAGSSASLKQEQIDRRIREIQPNARERRFDAIGWAGGICEAERLAREARRPVFLFSNVGQLDIGRC
jgi:hypothetical protein